MTCCAADRAPRLRAPLTVALLAAALAATGCASAPAGGGEAMASPERGRSEGVHFRQDVDAARLVNLRLSPRYSSWLVGPIARLASDEEEEAYLALTDDAAAEGFIDRFWQRRDPYPARPDNPLREEFEVRAGTADRLYTEGTHLGHHTARGTVFVIYGGPARTDYEIARDPRDPPVEVWFYSQETTGLDGSRPAARYRFIKRDDVTRFYTPRVGIERARPVRPGT